MAIGKATQCHVCGKPVRYETLHFAGVEKVFQICGCAEAEEKARAERDKIASRLARFKMSGLPDGLRQETMDDWKRYEGSEPLYTFYQSFVKSVCNLVDDGASFLLSGPYGCGKTKIAACLFVKALEGGYFGRYVNATDLKFKLRVLAFDPAGFRSMMEDYQTTPLLFIDDLGQSKLRETDEGVYYTIINERALAKRSTFITTHCNSSELGDVVGQEVVSRIVGMCGKHNIIVAKDGKDMRSER